MFLQLLKTLNKSLRSWQPNIVGICRTFDANPKASDAGFLEQRRVLMICPKERGREEQHAGAQYRPLFYDFNALNRPFSDSHKIVPEFQVGSTDKDETRFRPDPNRVASTQTVCELVGVGVESVYA